MCVLFEVQVYSLITFLGNCTRLYVSLARKSIAVDVSIVFRVGGLIS